MNPILSNTTFKSYSTSEENRMTINGTIVKTLILLCLLSASSLLAWYRFKANDIKSVQLLLKIALPITFFVGWITYFKPNWTFITGPLYAITQGFFVGTLSSVVQHFFPNVVNQAIPLTFSIVFGLLFLYSTGIVRVTRKLQTTILVALFAITMTYLLEFILSFFNVGIPYIHESGMVGIGFSLLLVVTASFTLLIDFEAIVQNAKHGAPQYMEWYCAYALMVTLVWLYMEILRLLMKISKKR